MENSKILCNFAPDFPSAERKAYATQEIKTYSEWKR